VAAASADVTSGVSREGQSDGEPADAAAATTVGVQGNAVGSDGVLGGSQGAAASADVSREALNSSTADAAAVGSDGSVGGRDRAASDVTTDVSSEAESESIAAAAADAAVGVQVHGSSASCMTGGSIVDSKKQTAGGGSNSSSSSSSVVMSKGGWHRVDVWTGHVHAHATIIVRDKRYESQSRDLFAYLVNHMSL
jgi:hypothetical protein